MMHPKVWRRDAPVSCLLVVVTLTFVTPKVVAARLASCPSVTSCSFPCEFGFRRDEQGCELCSCQHQACQGVTCDVGLVCEVAGSSPEVEREYEEYNVEMMARATCVDPKLAPQCKHPMDSGKCHARLRVWYYDTEYGECNEFKYFGCYGNSNRFHSNFDCQSVCQPDIEHNDPTLRSDGRLLNGSCPYLACEIDCPNGRLQTHNGCDTCQCNPNACEVKECPTDTFCKLSDDQQQAQCILEDGSTESCDETECERTCQYGYQTNKYGCSICACRDAAVDSCPPPCDKVCPFGHEFDTNRCRKCACLPNPCEEQSCGAGETCELTRSCAVCRQRATCTPTDNIRRVHIAMTFMHAALDTELDNDVFERQVVTHVSKALQVDEADVRRVSVRPVDSHTLAVDFHVLRNGSAAAQDQIGTNAAGIKNKIMRAMNYQSTQFTPERKSIIVTFHSSGLSQGNSNSPTNFTTLYVIVGIVVAAILIGVIAAIVNKIRSSNNSGRRKSLIEENAGRASYSSECDI